MRRLHALLAAAVLLLSPAAFAQDIRPRPANDAAPVTSLAGQLLVAAPGMPDPRFAETVIYMVEHDAGGALGIIVNKAVIKGPMAEFLESADMEPGGATGDVRLHYGGPVQPNQGFVVHTPEYRGGDTIAAGPVVSVSTELDVLAAVADGRGPRHLFIAFGYAGWGPGQLEGEIDRQDWRIAPVDAGIVFDDAQSGKWDRALAMAGLPL